MVLVFLTETDGGKEWTWRGKYSSDTGAKTITLLPSHSATPDLQKSKKLKNKGEEKWVLTGNDSFTEWTGTLAGSDTTLKLKEKPEAEDDDLGF
jgi:hypothetical protein